MRNIVITRPREQAALLIDEIAARGDRPIACPLLTICPESRGDGDWRRLSDDFDRLDRLVVVSPTAASILRPFLMDRLSENSTIGLAASGWSTAVALSANGDAIALDDIVYPQFETGSAAILALDCCQDLRGRRVGIIGGHGGSDRLSTELSARGAIVSRYRLYRRELTPRDRLPLGTLEDLTRAGRLNTLVVSSSEAMRYLAELIDRVFDSDTADRALKVPLLTIHRRIERIALNCGFSTTICVDAHRQAIIEALYNRGLFDQIFLNGS